MQKFCPLLNSPLRVSLARYFNVLKKYHKNRVYSARYQLDIVYILFAFVG